MNGVPTFAAMYACRKCQKSQKALCGDQHNFENQPHNLTTASYTWARMSIDFLAGCLGGCAGVLVGHPLDTIKVHLQTQDPRNPKYRGIIHCMVTIFKEDKLRGLYRGMTSPMAGVGLVNAIVFGIYGNVQRASENPNSLETHFWAGSIAGLLQSVVCAPIELAKTRLQLQHESQKGLKFKGPLQCIQHIYRTEGLRGAFKGLGITAIRDVPGFASYFVSYEYMMNLSEKPSAVHTLIAGGFAGIFSWLACYPTDVIKTILQADGMSSSPQYTGIMDCARKGYAADGYHFFVRGLGSTLIRTFPMNAACFFVVATVMDWTKDTKPDLTVPTSGPVVQRLGIDGTRITLPQAEDPTPHLHEPLHVFDAMEMRQEMERKRLYFSSGLKALGTFNEAVCQSEVDEMAKELFPDTIIESHTESDEQLYYIFADDQLLRTHMEESERILK